MRLLAAVCIVLLGAGAFVGFVAVCTTWPTISATVMLSILATALFIGAVGIVHDRLSD